MGVYAKKRNKEGYSRKGTFKNALSVASEYVFFSHREHILRFFFNKFRDSSGLELMKNLRNLLAPL